MFVVCLAAIAPRVLSYHIVDFLGSLARWKLRLRTLRFFYIQLYRAVDLSHIRTWVRIGQGDVRQARMYISIFVRIWFLGANII